MDLPGLRADAPVADVIINSRGSVVRERSGGKSKGKGTGGNGKGPGGSSGRRGGEGGGAGGAGGATSVKAEVALRMTLHNDGPTRVLTVTDLPFVQPLLLIGAADDGSSGQASAAVRARRSGRYVS